MTTMPQHPPLSRPRRLLPYWRLVAVLGLTAAALVPFWMVQNHDAQHPSTTSTFRSSPLEKNLRPPPNKPRGRKRSSTTATTNITQRKNPAEREVLLLVNNETTKDATTAATTSWPKQQRQAQVHIVFSTSCTDQQHWESYVFFYHCHRVQQQHGTTVTRIVSGCTEAQRTALTLFHQRYVIPLNPDYQVHFTPDYSRVALESGKRPYKYNNKPFGLLHYLEHHVNNHFVDEEQDVIALLDPDMVLLQPIPYDFSQAKNMMWVGGQGNNNNDNNNKPALWWNQVTLGQPIAQQDGYLNNEWTRFDRATIFANLTTPAPPSSTDAVQRYNAGPPYLATVADWRRLTRRWTQLAPPVLSIFPKLFAEMYSFVWATVYEQSPWQMTASLTISTTESSDREGWAYIDRLPAHDVCQIARVAVTNGTDYVLPVSLHYCGIYSLDRFLWSKYRVKKNIMNCDKNLLKVPYHLQDVLLSTTGDVFTADWPPQSNGKPSTSTPRRMSRRTAQRELFMLCALTTAVNEALRHYKHLACNGTTVDTVANLNETYEIFIDYSDY
jgi:peptidyl serine alpha-galactosyltransferase